MVGFEKVEKRRVPFAAQCKYTKYTGCRKIYVFQVGRSCREKSQESRKNKIKNIGGSLQRYMGLKVQTFHHVFFK
jgi:hypothetical protein